MFEFRGLAFDTIRISQGAYRSDEYPAAHGRDRCCIDETELVWTP